MQFRVDKRRRGVDHSLPPQVLPLPACADLRSLVTPAVLKNPRRAYLNVIQGPNGPVMLTLSDQELDGPDYREPQGRLGRGLGDHESRQ